MSSKSDETINPMKNKYTLLHNVMDFRSHAEILVAKKLSFTVLHYDYNFDEGFCQKLAANCNERVQLLTSTDGGTLVFKFE